MDKFLKELRKYEIEFLIDSFDMKEDKIRIVFAKDNFHEQFEHSLDIPAEEALIKYLDIFLSDYGIK